MKYRGVNLGGWLVLERWMTPSLFDGLQAKDELSFCRELGAAAQAKLQQHRDSFITHADLQWIKDAGLNAVRLPVPYWLFGDVAPYVGCLKYVDWLIKETEKLGLFVLLDVHAAPGSQNGQDHSGAAGEVYWDDPEYIEQTLKFIGRLVERYGEDEHVFGFELLNEPDRLIDHEVLVDFYKQGIDIVHTDRPEKLVIVSDAYRPHDWAGSELGKLPNVVLDMHLYQAFSEADKRLAMGDHVTKATVSWHHLIDQLEETMPVMVGEWSLGTNGAAVPENELTAYAIAQLADFNYASGWFFWSYKTESGGPWSFRDCYEKGLIPSAMLK